MGFPSSKTVRNRGKRNEKWDPEKKEKIRSERQKYNNEGIVERNSLCVFADPSPKFPFMQKARP